MKHSQDNPQTLTFTQEMLEDDYLQVRKIIIAIDGYAGSGKSTTAKRVAEKLSYTYIDTGAMYRTVALYFSENGIPYSIETPEMSEALDRLNIEFKLLSEANAPSVFMNGRDVSLDIRKPDISDIVSQVSAHKVVRQALVRQQRRLANFKGVVMDGRDIGTVVFPQAELKIFMTAELKTRAQRRKSELAKKGINVELDEVIGNLKRRDYLDTNRKESPLMRAQDAITVDTTAMTEEEQITKVFGLAKSKISEID